MGRTRRHFVSGKPYEICLRVKEGLPFVCLALIKLLIKSAMARALKGEKVVICHYVWMGNHLHMLIVVKDATACERFYEELQKKLTDYVKRLRGVSHLLLWEGRPSVAAILDVDMAKQRISYFYGNPSRADLVRSIDRYPGVTSWDDFVRSNEIDSMHVEEVPWIRCGTVPSIGNNAISRRTDRKIVAALRKSAKRTERLVVQPNYWMKSFALSDAEVANHNQDIRTLVHEAEDDAESARKKSNKTVKGAERLRGERFFKPHSPKKKERKIQVLSSIKELRIAFIQNLKALCDYCRRLYQERRFDEWPPGMFRPPMGVLASALDY